MKRALVWLLLLPVGCSLEGFAGGAGGGGGAGNAGVGGGGASSAGGGGGCLPCSCGPWSETLVSDAGPAVAPSLAWTDGSWAIAWQDARDGNPEIYLARLDAAGVRLAAELRVTSDPAESLAPTLVWAGDHHAIGYEDTRSGNSAAYLAWVDAMGQSVTLDLEAWKGTGAPKATTVSYGGAGNGYVLAWQDFRDLGDKIHTIAVDDGGAVVGVEERITDAGGDARFASMAYGNLEHGMVWEDTRDGAPAIRFARLDTGGFGIGADARVSGQLAVATEADIAFGASGYGVVWSDARDGAGEIYFAGLTRGGENETGERRVTSASGDSRAPSIAWDGSGYAIAWQDDREGTSAIHFVRLDASGEPLGPAAVVAGLRGAATRPSLVWSGTSYGIAWQDARSGVDAIYFASCMP